MSQKKSGRLWGLVLVLALNLALWNQGVKAASPMEDVKGMINEVQTILKTHSQKDERVSLIEKVTARHLDFQEMSKRCLGPTWNKLSEAQKKEFVHLFSELLKAHYANHLDEFAKASVTYLGETCSADSSEVRICVHRPNDQIPVCFRLHQMPDGWKIYDLNIEGVSLVSNFRTQFSRTMNGSGYEGLVARLKTHLQAMNHS